MGLITLYGLLNVLYQTGGQFTLLFPVLFWVKVVLQTTGALAFVIACYSYTHKAQISAHWYSLPTGSSSIALITQYVPATYLALFYSLSFLLYLGYLSQKGGSVISRLTGSGSIGEGKKIIPPVVLFALAAAIDEWGAKLPLDTLG